MADRMSAGVVGPAAKRVLKRELWRELQYAASDVCASEVPARAAIVKRTLVVRISSVGLRASGEVRL
ncbi:hypothetical protein RRF57_012571 [Xylaria bambusicola]|uniref:Uncharacterized protein n=1 Tax=Xylaria bambusicola TaxID=326684 RepID=A0AAN7V5S2_9PEZI